MKVSTSKLRVLFLLYFSFITTIVFSQVDKDFWFSIPYVSKNHAVNYQAGSQFQLGGGQPIYLRLATLDNPAIVRIQTPANSAGIDTIINIAANSTATLDLTPFTATLEVSQTYSTIMNGPENKGIHITSTDFITAYYENATIPNPEVFTLKGTNALGTEFYTPFQTNWPNDPLHNYQKLDLKNSGWQTVTTAMPDSAFSAFDIVATEDGTVVEITPTADVVGHKKGETFSVVLQKGQTYSVRQLDQAIVDTVGYYVNKNGVGVFKTVTSKRDIDNLSGSHIVSNNPIAISVKDDSIFPNDITESGDCEDYIGDQIVPVNVIGREYVVMKGNLSATKANGSLTDWVFLLGVKDGTKLTIDGKNAGTINKGQTLSYQITDPYMHILSSDSIYAFHISGYNCEFASAILPPINNCTGSDQVGFTRTYGTFLNERFFANILVRKGGEKSFTGDPIASIINAATFTPLPDPSAWSFAQIEFTSAQLPIGPHLLKNTQTYFHFSMINSTVFNWAAYNTWTDANTQLQGSSYGYFSSYNVSEPKAIIGNNNQKVIQVPIGAKVQLIGQGGFQYNWLGTKYNEVSGKYDVGLASPYYLNKTNGYNPVFDGTAPVGKYQYTAQIIPACANMYVDTVYIEVIPPIVFNNVTDSICEDAPGSKTGAGYNLFNLNDTIVGVKGKAMNYAVSEWFVKNPGGAQILEDAELKTNVTYGKVTNGTLYNTIANPDIESPNTTSSVVQLTTSNNNSSVEIIPNTPISFNVGNKFSIQIHNTSTNQGYLDYLNNQVPVVMNIWDGTTKVSVTQYLTADNWKTTTWQDFNFDFSAFSTIKNITKISLDFSNPWNNNLSYQFDNLSYIASPFNQKITNPTNYTIHDNDTVYAIIKNSDFPYFSDTAKAIFGVYDHGKIVHNINVPAMCATSGTKYDCFDLTQYKYSVGGALVAQKDWFYDQELTLPVANPKCVNIGSETFWAKINDKCNNIGSVTFNIIAVPTVNDSVATVCADPNATGNTATNIKLENYLNYVLPQGGPEPEWYLNEALTMQQNGSTAMSVTDKQIVYAKVFNNAQCFVVAKLQFNVTPLSKINMSVANYCMNHAPVTLTATPVGGSFSGDGVTGFVFDPATAGVGKHQITYLMNINECPNVMRDTIEVYEVPTATVDGPTDALNYNTSTQLSATVIGGTPNYTYVWSPAESLTNASISNPTTIKLTAPQQFCLTVTDIHACADTKCVTVNVKDAPLNVKVSVNSNNICLGNSVNLTSIIGGGVSPYTVSWSSSKEGFTSTLEDPSHTPASLGEITYTITVTDDIGSIATASTTVTVSENPNITFSSLTPSICQNGTLLLTPTITGDDATATYTWTGSPVALPPLNGKTLSIDASQNPGTYPVSLTVKNGNGGCTATEIVSVKINENPKVSVDAIAGACLNTPKQLNANPTGGTKPYTHLWTGNFTSGDISEVSVEDPIFKSGTIGVYTLTYTVSDANGCKASAVMPNFNLNVLPEPNIVDGDAIGTCQNTNSYLLKSEVKNPKFDLSTYTYSWTGINGTSFSSTDQNPIIDVSSTKTLNLKLKVTDANGCVDYDSTVLIVNPAPTSDIIGDKIVCQGQDLKLQSYETSSNNTYTWTGVGATYLTPKTGTNVVFNSSVPANNYTINLEVKDKTTGCVGLGSTIITVIPKPDVKIEDTTVCLYSSFMLNPKIVTQTSNYKSIWKIDTIALNGAHLLTPTFYAEKQQDYKLGLEIVENGCSGYDSMLVHVQPNPVANAGNDTTALNAVPFNLNGSATSGSAPYSYQWSPTSLINGDYKIQKPQTEITTPKTFTLVVTDALGCKDTDDVFVNIQNDKPEVVINSIHICGTQTVTLTAQPQGGTGSGYTYEWYQLPNQSVSIGTGASINVNVTQQTIFMVKMTNAPYPVVSDTATVFVHTIPTATIVPPEPLKTCVGKSLLLTAPIQAGVTYEWINGVIHENGNTYEFPGATQDGLYNIILNIKNQYCSSQKTLNINVYKNPTVVITPNNPSICEGDLVTLNAITSPVGTYDYAWTLGASSTVVNTTANFNFKQLTWGAYTANVKVMDVNTGCEASTSDLIKVNKKPNYGLPATLTACTNQKLILDVNPQNAPISLTVTWDGPDAYTLVDKKDLTAPVFKSAIAGIFNLYYKIDDGKGCPKTDTVSITVYPSPIISTPDTLKICAGSKLDIEATVIGSNISILWDGNVVPTQNVTVTQFTSNTLPGKYNVIAMASSNQYCKSADTTVVVVRELPKVNAGVYPKVPYGGQLHLIGEAVNGFGLPPYTAEWKPSIGIGSVYPGTNGFEAQTISLHTNETYTIVITDKNGCTNWATADIEVPGGINPTVVGDSTNKPIDPVNPIDVPDPKKYPYLNTTGIDHICYGESISLVVNLPKPNYGSGDYSYEWTLDNDLNFKASTAGIKVSPTKKYNKYKVKLTDNKFPTVVKEMTFIVYVEPLPTPTISISDENVDKWYETQEITLMGNPKGGKSPYHNHLWSGSGALGLTSTTTQVTKYLAMSSGNVDFTYSITDSYGCVGSTTKSIYINSKDTIDIKGSSSVCGDGTIKLYSVDNVVPDAIYKWTASDPSVQFVSNKKTGPTVGIIWNNPGVYEITVENVNPNSQPLVKRTFKVTVYPKIDLDDAIVGPHDVCEYTKSNYSFDANLIDESTTLSSWSIDTSGNGVLTSSPYLSSIEVQWNEAGNEIIHLEASNAGGCSDVINYPVVVHKKPTAEFFVRPMDSVNTKQIYSNELVDFDNRSYWYTPAEIDQKGLNYYWDFIGDGIFVDERFEPTYSYDQKGTYNARLIVEDTVFGCRDTAIKPVVVVVNPHCGLKYPNAFTPGLKTDNNFTYGYAKGLLDEGFELKIFNRWGQLMWETKSKNQKWDGTYKGEACKQDVYVYQSTATCENGEVIKVNGDVTLLR